ncbi:hypothetical protein SETIT_5G339700v2 [Setaria italica]|uniref:Uncharacterized protein n=1 Tax=Setaria italica TaxID=4555 RepID=A0A368RDH7_SETIT|nr:hypothetical protein SETIT_5G339700v2 [Setaria italica]
MLILPSVSLSTERSLLGCSFLSVHSMDRSSESGCAPGRGTEQVSTILPSPPRSFFAVAAAVFLSSRVPLPSERSGVPEGQLIALDIRLAACESPPFFRRNSSEGRG